MPMAAATVSRYMVRILNPHCPLGITSEDCRAKVISEFLKVQGKYACGQRIMAALQKLKATAR